MENKTVELKAVGQLLRYETPRLVDLGSVPSFVLNAGGGGQDASLVDCTGS